MKSTLKNKERGVALLIALIALLILTAIAASMIFSSNIESSINTNYRSEQQAYFAARAGLEEARMRMLRPTQDANPPANTGDLCGGATPSQNCPLLPKYVPGQNGGAMTSTDMIYIENPSTVNGAVEAVDPKNGSYFDDELCKENYNAYPAAVGAGLRCSTAPGSASYQTPSQINAALANSLDPKTGTASALSYKWVRITLKQNWNTALIGVDGTNPGSASANKNSAVCFTQAGNEVLQSSIGAGYGPPGVEACMPNPATVPPPLDQYRPVYVVTSMAVTPNGSRRYLQAELADSPPLLTNASLDTQSIVNINGSSVTVDGNDDCFCTCTTGNGSAGPTCTQNGAAAGTQCTTGQQAIYSTQSVCGGDGTACGSGVAAPTSPAVIANASTFPYDVAQLITQYQGLANNEPFGTTSCGGGTGCKASGAQYGIPPTPFPPAGDPGPPTENPCNTPADIAVGTTGKYCTEVTYIPGSGDFTGQLSGAGILVVNGDLTLEGGANFYGLIIVSGTLTIKGSGSGQASNIIGGIITGKGTVTDQTDKLSGGINLQYDSCALRHQQSLAPPKVLSMRELSF